MSVDSLVAEVMTSVPKCVACGVVDMDSGMLLGVRTVDSHPAEVLDLVAATTKDLFEGENVTAIEDAFKRARGTESAERYFREILVLSKNVIHVFARLPRLPSVVLTVVCRADANLGLVLMKSRQAAAKAEI
ncbi:MAG: hypothetical protein R3A51_22340 [Nannocystaceae bacterium]|nr:hypothetical protein [Myxococcales bacterium]